MLAPWVGRLAKCPPLTAARIAGRTDDEIRALVARLELERQTIDGRR